MNKNYKIAILGAGYMAEEYLKVLEKKIFQKMNSQVLK